MRRQFLLPEQDIQFLEDYGLPWETIVDGAHWTLIHKFPLPEGYNNANVIAAVRMETGYPNTPLDMVYFYPLIERLDCKNIGAAAVIQNRW